MSYPYYIRPMRQEDIDDVTEIDREAFPTQWPPADYHYELRNHLANYFVAYDEEKTIEPGQVATPRQNDSTGLLPRLRRWLGAHLPFGNQKSPSRQHYIIGFTGFWTVAEEAHIIIIAVREAYRQRGIGELLLISLIDRAMELKSNVITLEVRVSNTTAQKLYLKYGFRGVGTRPGYYVDRIDNTETREDGLLMTSEEITSAEFQTRFKQLKQTHYQKWGISKEQQVKL